MHKTELTIGCLLRISRVPWQAVSSCLQGATTNFITNHAPTRKAGITRTVVPEPGTWRLLSTALITLAGVARQRLIA